MSHSPAFTRTYNGVAKILHWTLALLIIAQLVIAFLMPDVHKGTKPEGLIAWHLTVGVLILLLAVLRVIWRIARPPVTTGSEDGAQKRIAAITHGLLYLGMLVIPVLGWANASWREWVVGLGSAFLVAEPADPRRAVGHEVGDIHGWLAWGLLGLIGLHVAAGLYHQIVLKDDALSRMR